MAIRGELAFVDDDVATDWRYRAACVGQAGAVSFFPERGESTQKAKAICAVCPVREPCLELALRTGSPGIWGGLSDRERRQLRRRGQT